MELVSNANAKSFKFYPAGADRKKAFVAIPKTMVKDAKQIDKDVNVPWSRVVAFGNIATVCKALYDQGATLFDIAKGRVRENSFESDDGETIESYDIVCMELAGDTAKAAMKELVTKTPAKTKKPKA